MERYHRWAAVSSSVLLFTGLAFLFGSRSLFLAAIIPAVYAGFSAVRTAPRTDALTIRRELSPESAHPGEAVEVTLTIENTGESVIPDLRVIDGVPQELAVTDGSPSLATTLGAKDKTVLEYTLIAKRGTYTFDPVSIRTQNFVASAYDTASTTPNGINHVECTLTVESIPLRESTTEETGPLSTETGGPGIEFHSTREYQPDDPIKRIDWRRYAKTGQLTTIQYHEYKAARVIVVIDARDPSYVVPRPEHPTAVELATYAASRAVSALRDAGHQVGLAAFGVSDPDLSVTPAWVEPANQMEFDARAQSIYDAAINPPEPPSYPQSKDSEPDLQDTEDVQRLLELLSPNSQVLYITPLLDSYPKQVTERLLTFGHPVTILSPDIIEGETLGQKVVEIERTLRITETRAVGASVINWEWQTALPLALNEVIQTSFTAIDQ